MSNRPTPIGSPILFDVEETKCWWRGYQHAIDELRRIAASLGQAEDTIGTTLVRALEARKP